MRTSNTPPKLGASANPIDDFKKCKHIETLIRVVHRKGFLPENMSDTRKSIFSEFMTHIVGQNCGAQPLSVRKKLLDIITTEINPHGAGIEREIKAFFEGDDPIVVRSVLAPENESMSEDEDEEDEDNVDSYAAIDQQTRKRRPVTPSASVGKVAKPDLRATNTAVAIAHYFLTNDVELDTNMSSRKINSVHRMDTVESCILATRAFKTLFTGCGPPKLSLSERFISDYVNVLSVYFREVEKVIADELSYEDVDVLRENVPKIKQYTDVIPGSGSKGAPASTNNNAKKIVSWCDISSVDNVAQRNSELTTCIYFLMHYVPATEKTGDVIDDSSVERLLTFPGSAGMGCEVVSVPVGFSLPNVRGATLVRGEDKPRVYTVQKNEFPLWRVYAPTKISVRLPGHVNDSEDMRREQFEISEKSERSIAKRLQAEVQGVRNECYDTTIYTAPLLMTKRGEHKRVAILAEEFMRSPSIIGGVGDYRPRSSEILKDIFAYLIYDPNRESSMFALQFQKACASVLRLEKSVTERFDKMAVSCKFGSPVDPSGAVAPFTSRRWRLICQIAEGSNPHANSAELKQGADAYASERAQKGPGMWQSSVTAALNPSQVAVVNMFLVLGEMYGATEGGMSEKCDIGYEQNLNMATMVTAGIVKLYTDSDEPNATLQERKDPDRRGVFKPTAPVKRVIVDCYNGEMIKQTTWGSLPSITTSTNIFKAGLSTYQGKQGDIFHKFQAGGAPMKNGLAHSIFGMRGNNCFSCVTNTPYKRGESASANNAPDMAGAMASVESLANVLKNGTPKTIHTFFKHIESALSLSFVDGKWECAIPEIFYKQLAESFFPSLAASEEGGDVLKEHLDTYIHPVLFGDSILRGLDANDDDDDDDANDDIYNIVGAELTTETATTQDMEGDEKTGEEEESMVVN